MDGLDRFCRTMALVFGFLCLALMYIIARLAQPEVQAASDSICVPLYNETGLECCQ